VILPFSLFPVYRLEIANAVIYLSSNQRCMSSLISDLSRVGANSLFAACGLCWRMKKIVAC
jgi:hypothetical protein